MALASSNSTAYYPATLREGLLRGDTAGLLHAHGMYLRINTDVVTTRPPGDPAPHPTQCPRARGRPSLVCNLGMCALDMRDAQPRGRTGTIVCRQPWNVPVGMTDVTPLPTPPPTLCARARERCHMDTRVTVGGVCNLPCRAGLLSGGGATSPIGRDYCQRSQQPPL